MSKNSKLIVNFVPTGMIPTKEMTPHVPISSTEIAEQVHEAYEIGITMVHLHARDEDSGEPTYRKGCYEAIISSIRKYCPDLILCVSLSGRNVKEFEKRSEPIELEPDMGSLTLSSLNFPKSASLNSPEIVVRLAQKMKDYGVKPELEVFDLGMINYAKYMYKKGIISPPFYFNIIVGNIAGMQPNLSHLGASVNDLPAKSYWSFGGIGNQQLEANTIAIAAGGGVRIGLEDNIFYDRNRSKKATNKELVLRIHQLASIFEREIMKPSELGKLGFYNSRRKV